MSPYRPHAIVILAVIVALAYGLALLGRRRGRKTGLGTRGLRRQVTTMLASVLGLLALLLSFSFSQVIDLAQERNAAALDEASAAARVDLLADEILDGADSERISSILLDLLNVRLAWGSTTSRQAERREELVTEYHELNRALWRAAGQLSTKMDPVIARTFLEAVRELTDSFNRTHAAVQRRLPSLVIVLLALDFVFIGYMIGYLAGVENERLSITAYGMALLVASVLYLILDFDRPARGFVQIDQSQLRAVTEILGSH